MTADNAFIDQKNFREHLGIGNIVDRKKYDDHLKWDTVSSGESPPPVFSVPSQLASQASIEVSNAMFTRKFWNRNEFEVQRIDERLERFNENVRFSHQYELSNEGDRTEPFEPTLYFLRRVRGNDEGEEGVLHVMNDEVTSKLVSEYIK